MAINDIFECRVTWTHENGRPAEWVSHVRCVSVGSGSGNSPNLAIVMANSLDVLLPNYQHITWTPGIVAVQNLTNGADYSDQPLNYTNVITGAGLPSFLAVGFRSPKQPLSYNRSRANMPLLASLHLGAEGQIGASTVEALEPLASYLGSNRVAASTGEQWQPITIRKIYSNHVLVDVEERQVVAGVWEIDNEFTTVKSRQAYDWHPID